MDSEHNAGAMPTQNLTTAAIPPPLPPNPTILTSPLRKPQETAQSPHPRSSPNRLCLNRNEANLEKMVRKNIRNATGKASLKRGLAVVEYFKSKQLQENDSESEKAKKIANNNQLPLFASPTRSPHRKRMQSYRSPHHTNTLNNNLRGEKASQCGSLTARLLSPVRSKPPTPRIDNPYDLNVARMVNPHPPKAEMHPPKAEMHPPKAETLTETKSKSPFQSFQKLAPMHSKPLKSSHQPMQPPSPRTQSPPQPMQPPPTPTEAPPVTVSTDSIASKSMCFALESPATCIDVTPDGQILIVAFEDGSIRLFDMDSSISSDRFGYLLGHFEACDTDAEASSTNFYGTMQLRIKISSDGQFLFVGSRVGPRMILAINLQDFRNEEEEQAKFSHSNGKFRGFADVANGLETNSYLLLTGLGVQTFHLWQFQAPSSDSKEGWQYLTSFSSNGNRALSACFFPSNDSHTFAFASHCEEKNVQIWCNYIRKKSEMPRETLLKMTSKTCGKWSLDTIRHDIPNTRNVLTLCGSFAYAVHPNNEQISQFQLENPSDVTCNYFEIEKFSAGKSRRSSVLLTHISASKDGRYIAAISSDGILYGAAYNTTKWKDRTLQIAGRLDGKSNPLHVYTPSGSCGMLAILANRDSGCLMIDPVHAILQRYGQLSNFSASFKCSVCHVPNARHWNWNPSKSNESSGHTVVKQKRIRVETETNTNAIASELEMYKQRYNQIVTEWQRRLKGERQMRRLFKSREQEFREQLSVALQRADTLEADIAKLQQENAQKETKCQMEETEKQQRANVKAQYRILCTQLQVQLTDVKEQKRTLEKTTRTMLEEMERYVSASHERYQSIGKSAECVVCREKEAVMAIVPCGHLCFCENDGKRYQREAFVGNVSSDTMISISEGISNERIGCPICQKEIIALLRVY